MMYVCVCDIAFEWSLFYLEKPSETAYCYWVWKFYDPTGFSCITKNYRKRWLEHLIFLTFDWHYGFKSATDVTGRAY